MRVGRLGTDPEDIFVGHIAVLVLDHQLGVNLGIACKLAVMALSPRSAAVALCAAAAAGHTERLTEAIAVVGADAIDWTSDEVRRDRRVSLGR